MNIKDNLLIPLTEENISQLQQEHPDEIVASLSQEHIDQLNSELKEIRQEEQEFPVLKQTQESLELFRDKMALNRSRLEFIEKLEYTPIKAAIQDYLTNLSGETRRNYAYYISDMINKSIIPENDAAGNIFTVGHFNQVPHERIIDYIKANNSWGWSEATKQLKCACYISLTSYLNRISQGWFRKALPSMLAANPTFYQVRDKCVTKALQLSEWHRFIDALQKINLRDALMARCMLQGAKRISEVIDLKIDQIDFEKNIIRFRQSKTGGTIKEIPITYPAYFLDELKKYIEQTSAKRKNYHVFITRTGKQITRVRLNYSFAKASENANLKKVTPHMLRTTWVTLVKQQGIQDTEIMKVTGHTSSKMIYAYDKTSAEDNCSKKLILI